MLEEVELEEQDVLEVLHPKLVLNILDHMMFEEEGTINGNEEWVARLQKYNVIRPTTRAISVFHGRYLGRTHIISFRNGRNQVVLTMKLDPEAITRVATEAMRRVRNEEDEFEVTV